MKRLFSILFHSLLFLGLLLAIDQAFVHLPLDLPGLRQSQSFYLDFRSRLLGLAPAVKVPGLSVEQLIEAEERASTKPKAVVPAPAKQQAVKAEAAPKGGAGPRYLYPDASGQLQFADRLEEIPAEFRTKAQLLAQ